MVGRRNQYGGTSDTPTVTSSWESGCCWQLCRSWSPFQRNEANTALTALMPNQYENGRYIGRMPLDLNATLPCLSSISSSVHRRPPPDSARHDVLLGCRRRREIINREGNVVREGPTQRRSYISKAIKRRLLTENLTYICRGTVSEAIY